jgi:ribonuclease HI
LIDGLTQPPEKLFFFGCTTNNVAEYEGVLLGLEALLELGQKKILVQSDSQLLVCQLNEGYRVKDQRFKVLKVLSQRAMTLLRQFDAYRIVHVRRELNRLADRLVNEGIDTRPTFHSRLEWIERSLRAREREGRKVRTP